MKKQILIAGATFLVVAACAQRKDTVLIKRPFYLGFTLSASSFGPRANEGTPFDMNNLPASNEYYQELYNDRSFGIELAFPFLRKWECEADFEFVETKGWKQSCHYWKSEHTQPPTIYWMASSRNIVMKDWRLRSFFSYEFQSIPKISFNAGAGGWYSPTTGVGAEAGMKMYYMPWKYFALQAGAYVGYTAQTKLYTNARFSILLSGTRTYRVRPDYYYVRTYED